MNVRVYSSMAIYNAECRWFVMYFSLTTLSITLYYNVRQKIKLSYTTSRNTYLYCLLQAIIYRKRQQTAYYLQSTKRKWNVYATFNGVTYKCLTSLVNVLRYIFATDV